MCVLQEFDFDMLLCCVVVFIDIDDILIMDGQLLVVVYVVLERLVEVGF